MTKLPVYFPEISVSRDAKDVLETIANTWLQYNCVLLWKLTNVLRQEQELEKKQIQKL